MNVGLIKNIGKKVLIGTGIVAAIPGAYAVNAVMFDFIKGGCSQLSKSSKNLEAKLKQQLQADTFQKTDV